MGQPKAQLAAARLRALNPDIDVQAYGLRLSADNAADLIAAWDLVIDCTDNFSTKFLINDVCVSARKPAILSSIYQYEGQLQVIRPDRQGACLRCIWPEATRDGLVGNCAEAGVLGPVPGVFGSLQALEALKILLGLPGQLGDELLVMDLLTLQISRMQARRASACAAGPCARIPAATAAAHGRRRGISTLWPRRQAAGYTVVDIREPHEVAAEAAARHGYASAAPAAAAARRCRLGPGWALPAGVCQRPAQPRGRANSARARLCPGGVADRWPGRAARAAPATA